MRHFPVVVEGSYQRYNRALRRHDTVRALPSDGIQPGSWGRHVSASRPNNPALDFVPHRGFVPINDVIDDARRGARGSGGMLLLGGVVAAAGGLALAIATRPRAGD